jgi:hypothetical protein
LPQNVLQAAEADLMRRYRNQDSLCPKGQYEHYAFHRAHVRMAKSIKQLVRLALMDPARGLKAKKKNTLMLYRDGALLAAALRYLQRNYEDGHPATSDRTQLGNLPALHDGHGGAAS